MRLESLTASARELRESRRLLVATLLVSLCLLAPSAWHATRESLPTLSPLSVATWYTGTVFLCLYPVVHLLGGVHDADRYVERYSGSSRSRTFVLVYALARRTGVLAAVILSLASAVVVGFVTGIARSSLAVVSL